MDIDFSKMSLDTISIVDDEPVQETVKPTDELTPDREREINDKEIKEKLEANIPYKEIDIATKQRQEMITRITAISKNKIGVHPLCHTIDLTDSQRRDFIFHCEELIKQPINDVVAEFNKICIDKIFDSRSDWAKYPVYYH